MHVGRPVAPCRLGLPTGPCGAMAGETLAADVMSKVIDGCAQTPRQDTGGLKHEEPQRRGAVDAMCPISPPAGAFGGGDQAVPMGSGGGIVTRTGRR